MLHFILCVISAEFEIEADNVFRGSYKGGKKAKYRGVYEEMADGFGIMCESI